MRFSVDPDHLATAAPTFTVAGAELAGAVDRLRNALAGIGAPWGDDAQGRAFFDGYESRAEAVATAADRVSAGLDTVGDGVDAMGRNHATTEAGVRSGLVAR